MDTQTWIVATSSVASGILGAVLAILYRDFRDRPRLRIDLDHFGRARNPVKLPIEIHAQMRLQGTFHQWLDQVVEVKWNASKNFKDNEFTLPELKDLRHLAPQFLMEWRSRRDEVQEMKDSMATPETPASPSQALTLSRVRSYWQEAFNEDIFIAYQKDPEDVAKRITSNFDGDIQQQQWVIEAVEALVDWLERGLDAQAAPADRIVSTPQMPESPRKPFVRIELLAVNAGRTETLITDRARLCCKNLSVDLRSYGKYGYEVFSGKFWRVKPSEVQDLVFSQDPDHTTQDQLTRLRDLVEEGRSKAYIEVQDYAGRRTRTSHFVLRDRVE